ncbi:MAG: hypothetical protein IT480_04850 [Gammaproteobacteria bacterium]|nr:hypothetical protein [Gammaproteobacteria bacterium]
MRIAKPVLLVATPIGVAGGLYEGYRLTGGLVFLMAVMLVVIGIAIATVVAAVRRERAAEAATARLRAEQRPGPPAQ